jgi:hypothetical protein
LSKTDLRRSSLGILGAAPVLAFSPSFRLSLSLPRNDLIAIFALDRWQIDDPMRAGQW